METFGVRNYYRSSEYGFHQTWISSPFRFWTHYNSSACSDAKLYQQAKSKWNVLVINHKKIRKLDHCKFILCFSLRLGRLLKLSLVVVPIRILSGLQSTKPVK